MMLCSLSCGVLLPSVEFEELFTPKYIMLISYVAGENLDWYLGHKYAHNGYNCTHRSP